MSSTESTKLSLHHLSPNGPFDGSQLLYHFFLVAFIEYAVNQGDQQGLYLET